MFSQKQRETDFSCNFCIYEDTAKDLYSSPSILGLPVLGFSSVSAREYKLGLLLCDNDSFVPTQTSYFSQFVIYAVEESTEPLIS